MKKTGTAVMDDGWGSQIKKAVAKGRKETATVKAGAKADPKKKKAAIEAAIKNVKFDDKKKKK